MNDTQPTFSFTTNQPTNHRYESMRWLQKKKKRFLTEKKDTHTVKHKQLGICFNSVLVNWVVQFCHWREIFLIGCVWSKDFWENWNSAKYWVQFFCIKVHYHWHTRLYCVFLFFGTLYTTPKKLSKHQYKNNRIVALKSYFAFDLIYLFTLYWNFEIYYFVLFCCDFVCCGFKDNLFFTL